MPRPRPGPPGMADRGPRARVGAARIARIALIALCAAWPAAAATSDSDWLSRLDPGLVAARVSEESLTVWVSFLDRGESGPAELARALGEARALLTPRARARRERALVWPLVDERDLPVAARYLDALAASGLRPFAVSRWLNRAAVRLPGTRLTEVAGLPFVARVRAVERARHADLRPERAPDARVEPRAAWPARAAVAGALDYGRSRAQLEQLNLPAVHDSGYVGTGVLVCILDNGFHGHDTHEALRDQVIAPGHRRDFVEGDTVVTGAGLDHGTSVLGCLGANRPGAYLGAAFGASFALARTEIGFLDNRVEMLYWGNGAEWADSLGADIISSSLGYFDFVGNDSDYVYADMDGRTTDVSRFAQVAAAKGMLVVNAVGNQGNPGDPWHFLIAPSDVNGDSLIAVGAVDGSGRVGAFSSYGPSADGRVKPDLAARGVAIPVVAPRLGSAGYESLSGTSFSTPLVAGLAACLMQARPWRPTEVARALRETASQAASPDQRVGYGIPDGAHALCWSADHPLPRTVPAAEVMGPNPAVAGGPPAQVRFTAGGQGTNPARIRVLDLAGREVRDLWSGSLARGECLTVSWDGRDDGRRLVQSGCYFLSLQVAGVVTMARVAWLR